MDNTPKNPFFSNAVYDRLKFVATILLPASAAAYFGLSEIWGLPFGTEIVGTITVLDTFLGAVLLLSSSRYAKSDVQYDGALVVDTSNPEKDSYLLEVDDLDNVAEKANLNLKVTSPDA